MLPSVIGELHTAPNAMKVGLNASGRRRSTGSVSPNRYDHTIAPMAIRPGPAIVSRHPPRRTSPSPIVGAITGAMRNTAMTTDITRAIRFPA